MRENNREALLKRGFLELENKQYETALATFQQADSLFPDDAEVKYAMFQAFYNLEQYETALQCLDKALAIAPDYKLAAETREKLLVQLREGAYLQLIDALLQCSEGEEGEILAANEHLIDAGLIATIEQVAEYYEQQEAEETSNWLRNLGQYLAQYLEDYRPTQAHYDFLLEILQTINDGGEKEQVYPLLQQNIDQLDLKLAYALENWADNTLSQIEDKITKKSLGYLIWDFSNFISEFPLGNRANNIEITITGYDILLNIFTEADSPQDWAMTQNNLGTAYSDRIRGDKGSNLERAIASYQQALTVYTPQDFPQDWAMTQNNLGTAYRDRIRGDKAENLERAIASYEQALTVYTPQDFPQDWAGTQNNLGLAYSDRIRGDKAENLERAIASYQQALTVRTPQDFPIQWAMTQNNLGLAYSDRIRGDKAENLERAIASYQQALTVRTPQDLPLECLQTSRNLGDLAFNQNNWELAKKTYSLGIEAVEQSRSWVQDYQRKQEILSDAIEVYQNMVQACIYSGQIEQAIEYIERSKARNLVELLALRDLYPKGDIPQEVINNLDHLRQSIIVEERLLRQQASNINNLEPNRINQLRQQLENLFEREIKPNDPSFQLTQRVEPISFNQIQNSLPNSQTVLVEWYLGKENLSAFIIAQEQIPIQISYTQKQLNALTNKAEEYLFRYLGYIRIPIKFWLLLLNLDCLAGIIFLLEFQWQNKLPHLLTQLAESLKLTTIIEQIKQIIPDVERLIIVPHRWLHLLPLHALTLPDGKCLLDIFLQGVSYAPSVQLLSLTKQQEKSTIKNFFAVQNPNNDLPFTDFEVLTIKPLFHPYNDILKRTDATKTALTPARLKKANCAHFSCHGYFNFENPELSALLLAGSQIDKPIEQLTELELSKTRFLPSRDGGSIDLSKCLTLGEIFGLDLRQSRLTVLSACETGLTDWSSLTDEYIGLPSGFLYAGSTNVVSSLWAVNDLSTAFLMIKLYQNLQDKDFHDSVPIALNQAQLWLKNVTKEELEEWGKTLNLKAANQAKFETAMAQYEANSRPFASPYYWAAFYAVGY